MISGLHAVGQKSKVQKECGSFCISSVDKKQMREERVRGKMSLKLLPHNLLPPFNSHPLKISEYSKTVSLSGEQIFTT